MRVCGFSFIKNAVKYDYSIVEAISSVLPLCDAFVLAVGDGQDETLALIERINSPKIQIIHTVWDKHAHPKTSHVFAQETNKAFRAIADTFDWAFYIQGDEVVHEDYLPTIRQAMETYQHDASIDGLLFNYKHFYGSFDYVGFSSRWYQYEIRVVKNDKSIYSYRDAQGFRKGDNQKLRVALVDAYIYHYGWVRNPQAMTAKHAQFCHVFYSEHPMAEETVPFDGTAFEYERHMTQLQRFEGTHPAVMKERIARKNWNFDVDISFQRATLKDRVKRFLKRFLGINLYYTNYKLVKKS